VKKISRRQTVSHDAKRSFAFAGRSRRLIAIPTTRRKWRIAANGPPLPPHPPLALQPEAQILIKT
jgi:hypothetical protein